MEKITQTDRVLLHLYTYRNLNPSERHGVPFDITQDGVGESVGVSRPHASLILGRLEKSGMVTSRRASVAATTGSTTLRKVYYLTLKGMAECRRLLEAAEAMGPEALLPRNLNHCRSDAFDALCREDRDFLGCMLMLSMPVRIVQLPRGRDHPLLPLDVHGFVNLKPATREWYTRRATDEELRRWHSLAADWCADHGGPLPERLVHLTGGGRNREAAMLACDNRYEIMDSVDPATALSLDRLDRQCGMPELTRMVTFCHVRLGDAARARVALDRIPDRDPCADGALECEILLLEGNAAMALDAALDCYNGDAATALALGKSMASNGRYREAAVFLRRSRLSMGETGCLFRLDEALRWEGECYSAMGQYSLASGLMVAAGCAAKDEAAGRLLMDRARVLASKDGVVPQCVQV